VIQYIPERYLLEDYKKMFSSKRWAFLSFMLVLALILVACGGDDEATPEPVEEATAVVEVGEEPTVEVEEEPDEVMAEFDCHGASDGDQVTVLYQWSGAQEEAFQAIMAPLTEACGITIAPESSRDQALLDTRVQAGTPWDIVIWPTTGPTLQYTEQLVGLGDAAADVNSYDTYWIDLGTIGGQWLAVPVKADIKSIIWYSPVAFDAFGYEVPTTFEGLDALVEQMVSDGNVPWSMGMESGDATGWTGSDFIQDLLHVTQGPDYVLGIIDGTIPYDDAGVAEVYEIYAKWASDATYTVGGADGTLSVGFLDAIYKQSGFAGDAVVEQFPELSYGIDFDFFGFPGAQGLQGGADWLMVFNPSPAVQAVVDYITSEAGGQAWAAEGFDLSPNRAAVGNYANEQLANKGGILANATGFAPDIGDSVPGGFGSAEWTAIVDVVSGGDVRNALADAAAVQAEALGMAVSADMGIDCMGASAGDEVTILYQWSGAQEESFDEAVAPVVEACGIVLAPESSRDQALLDTRVQAGTPWDIVIWPTTGPVGQYSDQLIALGDSAAHADNYRDYWIDLGSVGGEWLAVPVKADIKTIIWYSPEVFAAFGYQVPETFDELDALVEQMVGDGNVPWSMGLESGDATGWTGSDFIQDLLLVQQGPSYVLDIIDGSVSYDDAGVVDAYTTYAAWASDETYTVGGADGTLSVGFLNAIYKPFSDPPEAMMVKQSGFAGGAVAEQFPELVYGTDYDFFAFPGAQGMQGGADWLMVFNATPAAQALVAYMTSAAGAENWAGVGFDLSPNSAATGAYTDDALSKKAVALAGASGFTPDIGDSIPGGFGSAEWAAIVDVIGGGDIAAALAEAAAVQAEATGQ
jgi:alpha-glucoside transport system substrate-binding protein